MGVDRDHVAAPGSLAEWWDILIRSEDERAAIEALEAVVWAARDVVDGLPAMGTLRKRLRELDEAVARG